jgi:hypothetical protein
LEGADLRSHSHHHRSSSSSSSSTSAVAVIGLCISISNTLSGAATDLENQASNLVNNVIPTLTAACGNFVN